MHTKSLRFIDFSKNKNSKEKMSHIIYWTTVRLINVLLGVYSFLGHSGGRAHINLRQACNERVILNTVRITSYGSNCLRLEWTYNLILLLLQ